MKFSITIPAYKKAFFQEAINSCLSQTYSDFELIIVNDHSPEDLASVVNQYSDPRIHYYVNETNFGAANVVYNWNKCLEYATGEYVICMGDDDILLPNCLEDYIKLISIHPNLDVYHTKTQVINEHSEIIRLQESRPEIESVYSLVWHRFHGRIQYVGDFLFKTESLKIQGGFYNNVNALSSDDISVAIAASHLGIANTSSFGFQYRESGQTISNSGNIEQTIKGVLVAKQWYHSFLSVPAIDGNDELMRKMSLLEMDDYYQDMIRYLIRLDFEKRLFSSLVKWLGKSKDAGIASAGVLKLFLDVFLKKSYVVLFNFFKRMKIY